VKDALGMFTGIVEEVGSIGEKIPQGAAVRFRVRAPGIARTLKIGDSVSCDGVCLTAETVSPEGFTATAVPETLGRTTLSSARPGDRLNLEAALKAGSPMGGHIVQGHVDGQAEVVAWKALQGSDGRDAGKELTVRVPAAFARYCVEKGSFALHGVSLTIAAKQGDTLRFALVPHTLSATNLGGKAPGDRLNFEVDILGKYVESLLGHAALPGGAALPPAATEAPGPDAAARSERRAGALDPASLGKSGYGV
jgi:riboflavin synthase